MARNEQEHSDRATIGIDVGAALTKCGIARGDHLVEKLRAEETAVVAASPLALREYIGAAVDEWGLAWTDISTVNLGLHGVVVNGMLITSTRLPQFIGCDFREIFGGTFGRAINDAHAAALGARMWLGDEAVFPTCVLTLGTGVGIALWQSPQQLTLPEDAVTGTKVLYEGGLLDLHQYLGLGARHTMGLEAGAGEPGGSREYARRVAVGLGALIEHLGMAVRSFVVLGGATRWIDADSLLREVDAVASLNGVHVVSCSLESYRIVLNGLCHMARLPLWRIGNL